MLTSEVHDQQTIYEDITASVNQAESAVMSKKAEQNQKLLDEIIGTLVTTEKGKALEAALERGASS